MEPKNDDSETDRARRREVQTLMNNKLILRLLGGRLTIILLFTIYKRDCLNPSFTILYPIIGHLPAGSSPLKQPLQMTDVMQTSNVFDWVEGMQEALSELFPDTNGTDDLLAIWTDLQSTQVCGGIMVVRWGSFFFLYQQKKSD